MLDELSGRLQVLRGEADTRRSLLQEHQSSLEAQKARRTELNQRVQGRRSRRCSTCVRARAGRQPDPSQLEVKGCGLQDPHHLGQRRSRRAGDELKEAPRPADQRPAGPQMQLNLLGESDAAVLKRRTASSRSPRASSPASNNSQKEKFQLLELESKVARASTDCSPRGRPEDRDRSPRAAASRHGRRDGAARGSHGHP